MILFDRTDRLIRHQLHLGAVALRVPRGFQYGFSYRCKGRRIYQILDRATWELAGSVVGNTFIMRTVWSPPVVRFKRDTQYNTCWFFPGGPNRNATMFQLLPLYAELQGFTFQHDDVRS